MEYPGILTTGIGSEASWGIEHLLNRQPSEAHLASACWRPLVPIRVFTSCRRCHGSGSVGERPDEGVWSTARSSCDWIIWSRFGNILSCTERHRRSIDLLFVGQFTARKGLQELIGALRLLPAHMHLRLVAVGQGPLLQRLASAGFEIHDYAEPKAVAKLMADTKFLILTSLEEHWGVVVHEATLCGCGLILTMSVGSAPDLLVGGSNGILCDPKPSSIASAIQAAMATDAVWQSNAMKVSLKLGSKFGPDCFATSLSQLMAKVMISRSAKPLIYRLG